MLKSRSAVIVKTPEHIYLGFGSNLGDREAVFRASLRLLADAGCTILRISNLYNTEPWGGSPGDEYLNAVIELETEDSPQEFLERSQEIEMQLGRSKDFRYAPRTCDLDILLWRDDSIEKRNLKVPHPKLSERRFVLRPLCDLIPDKIHPIEHKTFRALLADVRDDLEVNLFSPQAEASQS